MNDDEYLLCSEESPQALIEQPIRLNAIALDKHPAQRWLAVSNQLPLGEIKASSAKIHIYQTMEKQLKSL